MASERRRALVDERTRWREARLETRTAIAGVERRIEESQRDLALLRDLEHDQTLRLSDIEAELG
jgi:hypothetical protein